MSISFPPIKADRCLLWIALNPDGGVRERFAALEAILKTCRLHPLTMTPAAEAVIVDEAALRHQIEAVRAVLGPGDRLFLIGAQGERLRVEQIAPPGEDVLPGQPLPVEQRPPWRRPS